ncbi:hypothetical protein [Nocardioides soli]|uniref:Uncharacterized protein n=1 Tax=Nocardioides soli TaxID=1036020 RepID=A0A7W4Z3D1_9ACTN|nr:hypothetical protein [Nocardioides soli]MBB3043756.1 hypothetical protein [Nocardioides soli]
MSTTTSRAGREGLAFTERHPGAAAGLSLLVLVLVASLIGGLVGEVLTHLIRIALSTAVSGS